MKSFKHARLAVAVAVAACGAMGGMIASQRTGAAMAKNAQAFLDSLTPEQREKAADPLDSADRTHWNFIPTNQFPRQGLPLKEMTEPQRKLAHRAAADRPQPARLHHDDDDHERPRGDPAGHRGRRARRQAGRRSRNDPRSRAVLLHDLRHAGTKGRWGWRVEGHHISLHFTIADGSAVVAAPTFWGTNPAEVREGPKKGLRTLDKEQDAGRALMMALDDAQKKTATFAEVAPNDILTKTKVDRQSAQSRRAWWRRP